MPTLCSYVVREDAGLAPNPFWGWCTLGVCTPNHQGTRLKPGDWIAGFLTKARGHRFLYGMQVEEVLDLNAYFHDARFEAKKPNLRGGWKERCGDNFYSRAPDGTWIQHRNRFHLGDGIKRQDTKYARVFVGSRFWYRGRSAAPIPQRFAPLAGGRGARVNHDPTLVWSLFSGSLLNSCRV
jgi:Nucleotide modification associated domain 2